MSRVEAGSSERRRVIAISARPESEDRFGGSRRDASGAPHARTRSEAAAYDIDATPVHAIGRSYLAQHRPGRRGAGESGRHRDSSRLLKMPATIARRQKMLSAARRIAFCSAAEVCRRAEKS